MAYFDELMQRAITVRNNVAPSSNTALLVGGVLVSIVSALQLLLDTKQGTLTFDDEPTDDSTNPVTSDGIYEAIADALASIDLSACEKIVNKVTAIDEESTDVQYPTAKLLYDSLQALANEYAAIYHTHHYTDIEQPAIVTTAGALGYTIDTTEYSHIITLTADTTLHLPTITAGTARIMRLTLIQDLTGGHGVMFDGGNAMVYNPYQVDLSQGLGGYRCWVTLWFDGAQWCYIATPYVLRSESQFDYTISGTSTGASVTMTINGSTMNIPVNAGAWEYGYNGAVTSLSLAGDTGVTTIDFSLSDGLAGVTSLAGAFSGCTALQSIDFTDCDLSAIVDATNAFGGCSALTALTIPSGEWLPDLDLSATAIGYSAMADVIIGLHTYATGTHTILFNSTIWDALSQPQQQTIFDSAQLKGWTTNAVMVVYAIKGKSTAASESFTLQFIDDNTQAITTETITCAVDGSGNWEYQYNGKKMYSINQLFFGRNTISQLEFTEELTELTNGASAFNNMANLTMLSLPNATFDSLTNAYAMFANLPSLLTLDISKTTFGNLDSAQQMFYNNGATTIDISAATFDNLRNAQDMFTNVIAPLDLSATTFPSLTNAQQMFYNCKATSITLNSATTFANLLISRAMFYGCSNITSLSLPNATFENVTTAQEMINRCTALTSLDLSKATFANATTALNMFLLTENITNINLSAATFANLTDASGMFNACYKLQSVDLSAATFTNVTNTDAMFYNDAQLSTIAWNNNLNFGNLQTAGGNGMFYNCKLLTNNYIQKVFSVNLTKLANAQQMLQQCTGITSLDLSNQTFGAMTNANNMFNGCSALQTLNLSNATFANLTSATRMMLSCTALTNIDLSAATFANLTNAQFMFNVLTALPTLSLPQATFEKVTNAQGMFSQYNNAQLTTISVPKATFESLATTVNANFFNGNYGNSIVNYTAKPLGVDNKAIGVSFAFYAPRLTYASFVSVANWVKDLSGLAAQTITLNATAWNALSAAEQNTIDTILSGKNWTRAIA